MAGGLGKVGRPQLDRFARADEVLGANSRSGEGDPYRSPDPAPGAQHVAGPEVPPPSPVVKKTLNLTTGSLDHLRHVDEVLMRSGRKAKETELVRAAIKWFARQPDETIIEAFDSIEKLSTGPRRQEGRGR